jgi:homoserine dehydrogenase
MQFTMKTIRVLLAGLGTVNRGWLEVLAAKAADLRNVGVNFVVVGVSDSSGVAFQEDGFVPDALIRLKREGRKVNTLKGFRPGVTTSSMPVHCDADLLIESTPGNLITGEPGLSTVRAALRRKMHVVLANKTPLILGFDELRTLCVAHGRKIAYSATVCGGLPVVNVLQRDLRLAQVKCIRGIFNATSNFVLQELERGGTLEAAIREAQRLGAAEADPSHDLHGHDAANKLYIILKSMEGFTGNFSEIQTTGIQGITAQDLLVAKTRGNTIKLLAEAVLEAGAWRLSVQPAELSARSFLGGCEGWEMGFEIETDLYERICMKNYEADPLGTSAAVMRDCLDVVGGYAY